MGRLRQAPEIVKLAKDLELADANPVEAVLEHCREKVATWIGEFKGRITLPRLHQLVDERLSLRHIVVKTDDELDNLVREGMARGELILSTLKHEFARGTEAITFKLRHPGVGMRRHLAVVDGRGDRLARIYFGKRHEESHLLSLSPTQLNLIFRRTHATRNAAEERLMDRIGGELAFYPPLFRPELDRLQRRYVRPCFQLVDDVRAEVCPDASWTATAIAVVEQNDFPAVFLTAQYSAKTRDQGFPATSWALRASPRWNRAAQTAGLVIPWNYRIPASSIIHRAFHARIPPSELHADERLGNWAASDGSRLNDLPVHVEVRRHGNHVSAILTLT